jgi:hypothetical protein
LRQEAALALLAAARAKLDGGDRSLERPRLLRALAAGTAVAENAVASAAIRTLP